MFQITESNGVYSRQCTQLAWLHSEVESFSYNELLYSQITPGWSVDLLMIRRLWCGLTSRSPPLELRDFKGERLGGRLIVNMAYGRRGQRL
jgi:hypothetical protein